MSYVSDSRRRRRLRRLVRWTLWLIGLAMVAIIAYIFLKPLFSPDEGTVHVSTAPQPAATVVATKVFDAKYVSLALPETYQLQAPQPKGNELESYRFLKSGLGRRLLTLTVASLPSGNIEDDASYYVRKQHPETYKVTPETLQQEKAYLVSSTQESQTVLFWQHKDMLLSLAVSGVSSKPVNDAPEFQAIVDSIRWK